MMPARRPLLVPYATGGITAGWTDYLRAYQDAGADALEIGLPFSDPMLDGATIQRASDRALARGTTTATILADLAGFAARMPVIVMTYANLALGAGFARRLCDAGVSGLIVPDLPVDAIDELDAGDLDLILLAAPATPDDRLTRIAARTRGFLYAVSVMGTTGERAELSAAAAVLAGRARARTTLPVLIGFGVSTPGQAATAGRAGDGVVIASALMRKVLDGATPARLGAEVAAYRAALDAPVRQEVPAAIAHAQIPGHRR